MVYAVVYFVLTVTAAVTFGRVLDRQMEGPRLRSAWSGRTAEARCTAVRTEEFQDADGVPMTRSRTTLEFRTADGRTVTFEERQADLAVGEGGFVTVYYDERDPEAATARTPSFGPRSARTVTTAVGCVFGLVTAGVLAALL